MSERRRMPGRARTTEQARAAVAARWTPDARIRAAIRTLVDRAPELTPAQIDTLRQVVNGGEVA